MSMNLTFIFQDLYLFCPIGITSLKEFGLNKKFIQKQLRIVVIVKTCKVIF